jgi:hypothetical protein
LALTVLVPLAGSGCGVFHRAPRPPAVLIIEPPILLPSLIAEPPMPPPGDLYPVALADPPAFPLGAIGPRPAPVRRAGNGELTRPEPRPEAAPAPAPPQLSSLTPYQQESYRRAALQALNNARRDLQTLYNRHNLDAQAVATRGQADEYVHQAQQALAQGDAMRAQTLAEKAETLARFLLNR